MVSGQRILRIIDVRHLRSVQSSLVSPSVSCSLKIHFLAWFGLKIASENYPHSQRPQDSPYNLNKLGMFESIHKCLRVHPLQRSVRGIFLEKVLRKAWELPKSSRKSPSGDKVKWDTHLPVRWVKHISKIQGRAYCGGDSEIRWIDWLFLKSYFFFSLALF